MKARYYVLAFAMVLGIGTNTLFCQLPFYWWRFGDTYPTSARTYSDVSCFFTLQGPGNENPGNFENYPQDDTRLPIPLERKQFIARQFKYVLFDQGSFCEREYRGGPVTRMMTPLYHSEARDLMNRNPDLIVFPYFSFTTIHRAHPWYVVADQNESWFLHELDNPN